MLSESFAEHRQARSRRPAIFVTTSDTRDLSVQHGLSIDVLRHVLEFLDARSIAALVSTEKKLEAGLSLATSFPLKSSEDASASLWPDLLNSYIQRRLVNAVGSPMIPVIVKSGACSWLQVLDDIESLCSMHKACTVLDSGAEVAPLATILESRWTLRHKEFLTWRTFPTFSL